MDLKNILKRTTRHYNDIFITIIKQRPFLNGFFKVGILGMFLATYQSS